MTLKGQGRDPNMFVARCLEQAYRKLQWVSDGHVTCDVSHVTGKSQL